MKAREFYEQGTLIYQLHSIYRFQDDLSEFWKDVIPDALTDFIKLERCNTRLMQEALNIVINDYMEKNTGNTSFEYICDLTQIIMDFRKLRLAYVDIRRAEGIVTNYINKNKQTTIQIGEDVVTLTCQDNITLALVQKEGEAGYKSINSIVGYKDWKFIRDINKIISRLDKSENLEIPDISKIIICDRHRITINNREYFYVILTDGYYILSDGSKWTSIRDGDLKWLLIAFNRIIEKDFKYFTPMFKNA